MRLVKAFVVSSVALLAAPQTVHADVVLDWNGIMLGTISGLISAFAAIASLNLAEKTDVLSASISEALNCTAFGLLTAVPLLLIHA